jgi:hypothetical protein
MVFALDRGRSRDAVSRLDQPHAEACGQTQDFDRPEYQWCRRTLSASVTDLQTSGAVSRRSRRLQPIKAIQITADGTRRPHELAHACDESGASKALQSRKTLGSTFSTDGD